MNQYVTGAMIKRLREEKGMTQRVLAEKVGVSEKAVSKWETGRGYPDISLIELLAGALEVSIIELFSGEDITNTNRSFDMRRMNLYVCPICGNIIQSSGRAVVSCCGVVLPALEAEAPDDDHNISIDRVEDEYYVTVSHEMSKTHYISFIIASCDDGYEVRKLYPEGNAEARFKIRGVRRIIFFCNRDGLFSVDPV